jgi:hypothetical protein
VTDNPSHLGNYVTADSGAGPVVGCEGRLALRYPMCTEGFDAVVCRDGAPLIAGRCGSSAGGSARVLVGDRERWRLVASGPEKASRAGTARRCARPGNACRFRLNSEQPVPGWVLVNVATGRIFDLNRPGMSGDSTSWEGWSHGRESGAEVSGGVA